MGLYLVCFRVLDAEERVKGHIDGTKQKRNFVDDCCDCYFCLDGCDGENAVDLCPSCSNRLGAISEPNSVGVFDCLAKIENCGAHELPQITAHSVGIFDVRDDGVFL